MLELILIIWLSIGFIISLATFLWDIYKADYYEFTLADLITIILITFSGPAAIGAFIFHSYKDVDNIVLFKHNRRQ